MILVGIISPPLGRNTSDAQAYKIISDISVWPNKFILRGKNITYEPLVDDCIELQVTPVEQPLPVAGPRGWSTKSHQ